MSFTISVPIANGYSTNYGYNEHYFRSKTVYFRFETTEWFFISNMIIIKHLCFISSVLATSVS